MHSTPPDSGCALAPGRRADRVSDAHLEAESEEVGLLTRRLRGGFVVVLAATLVSVLERHTAGQISAAYAAVKVLQLLTLVVGLGALRATPSRRRCLVVALALTVEVAVTTAASGWLTGETQLPLLLLLMFLLGTAALLPWGTGAQSAAVGVAFTAALPLLRLPATAAPSHAPLAAALVVGAGTSLWIAAAGARNRRAERRAAQGDASATLARFGNHMIRLLDPALIVEQLVDATREALRCDVSQAFLREPNGTWTPAGVTGKSPIAPLDPADLEALAERLREEPVLLVSSGGEVGTAVPRPPDGTRIALWIALQAGAELDGVLLAAYRGQAELSSVDRDLVLGLAQIAALALRNARLVADLERASRAKSDFVSMMSHEVRTPLNIVLGYAEMLGDPDVPPSEQADLVRNLGTAGRELLELIESTLEVGRLEAGRAALHIERVEIAALWRRLGAECARYRRQPGVALEWNDDLPFTLVATDQRRLAIVVRNLVTNACKFTERGYVRATLALEADAVVIRVHDTGIGIVPEQQDRIWEMFSQVDSTETRSYGGSGLGLYLVRRFVEQLGGTVGVESAPHVGSVFTVRLPRGVGATKAREAA